MVTRFTVKTRKSILFIFAISLSLIIILFLFIFASSVPVVSPVPATHADMPEDSTGDDPAIGGNGFILPTHLQPTLDAPSTLAIIPNVILIVSDDQTWESIDKMPYLKAQSEWFRFPNAFANVSLCCPARANILSGLYSHHSGVEDNFDGQSHDESSNLAVWLNDADYNTALIGKYLNSFPWDNPDYIPAGWDEFQTFLEADDNSNWYYNYTLIENNDRVYYGSTPGDYSTDVLAQKATRFLEHAGEPFFLYFAPYTPHGPDVPAPRHENADVGDIPRYPNFNEKDVTDKPAWIKRLEPVDITTMDNKRRSKYRQALAMDEAIANFVSTLHQRGIFGRTVIIYLTDNGVSLGEHRFVGKPCEYEECIRTPLLISYPMAPYGSSKEVNALVSNIDIAPSIAEMAQIKISPVDGSSFAPFLKGRKVTDWRNSVLLRWGGEDENRFRSFWGIRTLRYKYIELDRFSQKELYDLESDPFELVNLAGNPAYARIQAELASELDQLRNP